MTEVVTGLGSWLPTADLTEHLGAGVSPDAVERVRLATMAYVERVRPDLTVTASDGSRSYEPGPDVVEGAILLAARWHARKGSPSGVATYAEFGPANLPRLDPDVERLLGLGRHARPAIG